MQKIKNQYRQNIIFIVLSILIILFVIFLAKIIGLLKRPTSTTIVKNGELIKYEDVTGYIIRDEEIINTESYSGIVNTTISDGNRVAKDGVILSYVSATEKKLVKKISDLDDKIQEAMNSQSNVSNSDVKNIEAEIKNNLYTAVKSRKDVYATYEYKTAINQLVEKKAKIVGDLSPAGSKLKELIDERLEYEKELNSAKQVLKSPKAGMISYRVDGYENVLTPKSLSSLSVKELEKIKINMGQIIPIDTSKVKIIDNFYCYIAIPTSSAEGKAAKLNDKIKLRFDDTEDNFIPATIEYISDEDSTTRLIIVKITSNVENLIKYRKMNLDVVWWRDTGLKVPNDAIKYTTIKDTANGETIENIATITIQKSSYTEEVWVKVIRQADSASIIENYTDDELLEMGVSEEAINSRTTIKLYNDVILN